MGTGRAGKTTLSKMIKDKINSYNLIHSDALEWAMIRAKNEEQYYKKNVDKQKEFEQGEYFQKTLLGMYNSLISEDTKKYGYILECSQLHPKIVKETVDFNNTIVLCLGLGNSKPDDIVNQCITYDTEESWTYGLSKEHLLEYAHDWYNWNEMLKVECLKCGIKYIDTSKDRKEILNKILDDILESI